MGLFLAMSGIAGGSRSAVEEALREYAQSKAGDFEPYKGNEEFPDEERELWAGNAEAVTRHWPGVEAKDIENYLVTWDLDQEEPDKAYDDDEFDYHDCWQVVDFMRKLGLEYPVDDQGKALGATYRFQVEDRLEQE